MGTCLFSFYIVFDTQLMIGGTVFNLFAILFFSMICLYYLHVVINNSKGKHKYSISPEEYILAALNIYLDIINLLLFILRILGKK